MSACAQSCPLHLCRCLSLLFAQSAFQHACTHTHTHTHTRTQACTHTHAPARAHTHLTVSSLPSLLPLSSCPVTIVSHLLLLASVLYLIRSLSLLQPLSSLPSSLSIILPSQLLELFFFFLSPVNCILLSNANYA